MFLVAVGIRSRFRRHAFDIACLALGLSASAGASMLVPCIARAQSTTGTVVTGTVVDAATGLPVRADIVFGTRRALRSDSLGRFTLRAVPTGSVTLLVRAVGYRANSTPLLVAGGDSAMHVTVRMATITAMLSSVKTIAIREEREQFDETVQTSALTIRGSELSNIPALGERDALRAIAFLPGVSARNDFSTSFNVRGGEADQNLVMLDGIPIYNPFHLGGLFGTFIDAAVGEVELLTGGFSARHGGKLSSVLDVKSAEETRSGVHGSTDLSLLATSSRLAGSHGNGRFAWSMAGRRTYVDKVMQAMKGSDVFPYHFQDAQLHMRLLMPRGGTLSATAYTGKDVLDGNPGITESATTALGVNSLTVDWGNSVGGVTYTQPLGARSTLVQQLSKSAFRTAFAVPTDTITFAQEMRDVRVAGRLKHVAGAHDFTVGYETSSQRSAYRESIPFTEKPAFPDALASGGDTLIAQRNTVASLFIDDTWRVGDRLTLRPGVRVEHVGQLGWQGASPRIAAKYRVSRNFALTASAGSYVQWTHAVRNEDLPLRLFDFWMTADEQVPVASAIHLVLGAEHWLSPTQFLRVESYHKSFDGLVEPASSVDPRVRPSLLREYTGTAYGVDVYARQLERAGFSGWFAYSYAMSYRERDDLRYFAAHDRRHSANMVMSYAPNAAWTFGMHAGASTGTPYTGWAGHMTRWYFDPVLKTWAPGSKRHDGDVVHGARNAERLPFYTRLDVSVERRIDMAWATLRPTLSVVNLFDRRNVMMYALDDSESPSRIVSFSQLPFVPSIGMRLDF